MILSPRLAAVASLVPAQAMLADIGTDHAYLPVSLILSGCIARAIASDVRTGPLDHAKRTADEYGVISKMEFRLCDGLAGIVAEECDTITITGMGGETIADILSRAAWTKNEKRLILQPQSTQEILRKFLYKNGYKIISESVVREGDRWYPILLAQGGRMNALNPGELMAGCPDSWVPQPERIDYLRWLLERTQRQLQGLACSNRVKDVPRRGILEEAADFLAVHISRLSH